MKALQLNLTTIIAGLSDKLLRTWSTVHVQSSLKLTNTQHTRTHTRTRARTHTRAAAEVVRQQQDQDNGHAVDKLSQVRRLVCRLHFVAKRYLF
jgi:hypothetical protein